MSFFLFFLPFIVLVSPLWSIDMDVSGASEDKAGMMDRYQSEGDSFIKELTQGLSAQDINDVEFERIRGFIRSLKLAHEWDAALLVGNGLLETVQADSMSYWQLSLDMADVYRWKGDLEEALKWICRLPEADLPDLILADAYNLRGNIEMDAGDYSDAATSYKKAVKMVSALDDQKVKAGYLKNLASLYKHQRRYAESIDAYTEAYRAYENLGRFKDMAFVAERISNVAIKHSAFDDALDYTYHGYELFEKLGDKKGMVRMLNALSVVFRRMGYLDKSLENVLMALDISEKIHYGKGLAIALNNLGFVYNRLGRYEESERAFVRLFSISDQVGDEKYQAMAHKNLSGTLIAQGRYSEALVKLKIALQIYGRLKDSIGCASTLEKMASVYEHRQQYAMADDFYKDSLDVYQEANDRWGASHICLKLAQLALSQMHEDVALEYFEKSAKIAEDIAAKGILVDAYRNLFRLHHKLGDISTAAKYAEAYMVIQEEISSQSVRKKITDLQLLVGVEKKEREIDALKAETEINELQLARQKDQIGLLTQEKMIKDLRLEKERLYRWYSYGIAILSALLFFSLLGRYRYSRKIQSILEKQKSEIESQNQILGELNDSKNRFFSIIAHDLKNGMAHLNAGLNLLKDSGDDMAIDDYDRLVLGLSTSSGNTCRLLENLLAWGRVQMDRMVVEKTEVPVYELCQKISRDMGGLLEDKSLNLILKIPKGLYLETDSHVLEVALRNLLSNALKYSQEQGDVQVFYRKSDAGHELHVKDFGVGIPYAYQNRLFSIDFAESTRGTRGEAGNGLGLILVKEMLLKAGAEIYFESIPDSGSDFWILFPFS